jgi:hypothetical protein
LTWIRLNGTSLEPIQRFTESYYVPVSEYLFLAIMAFVLMSALVLFVLGFFWLRNLLDRYRLKYGFDREIEAKECSEIDTDVKLDKREKIFKRRTFKD